MDFCQLDIENLHITPFCKYQINQNRNSGSHIVVRGMNKKINVYPYFLNFPSDLNTIRYRKCSKQFVGKLFYKYRCIKKSNISEEVGASYINVWC